MDSTKTKRYIHVTEGCRSGRTGMTGNHVTMQVVLGFESLSFRRYTDETHQISDGTKQTHAGCVIQRYPSEKFGAMNFENDQISDRSKRIRSGRTGTKRIIRKI